MDAGLPYRRRSIRIPGQDYSAPGEYFLTICTRHREPWLGDPQVRAIVQSAWDRVTEQFPDQVETDAFVIMPNHVHGVVVLLQNGDAPRAPTIGRIVQWFKGEVTRHVRGAGLRSFGWQRNYYEHIIRSEEALHTVRDYIRRNPERWACDPENPHGVPDVRERAFIARFRASPRHGRSPR